MSHYYRTENRIADQQLIETHKQLQGIKTYMCIPTHTDTLAVRETRLQQI